MYFGAHPGDGSDYGFWLSESFVQDIVDNGGIKVSDTADVPRGYAGEVLYVDQHGNCDLYRVVRGRKYLLWSVV